MDKYSLAAELIALNSLTVDTLLQAKHRKRERKTEYGSCYFFSKKGYVS